MTRTKPTDAERQAAQTLTEHMLQASLKGWWADLGTNDRGEPVRIEAEDPARPTGEICLRQDESTIHLGPVNVRGEAIVTIDSESSPEHKKAFIEAVADQIGNCGRAADITLARSTSPDDIDPPQIIAWADLHPDQCPGEGPTGPWEIAEGTQDAPMDQIAGDQRNPAIKSVRMILDHCKRGLHGDGGFATHGFYEDYDISRPLPDLPGLSDITVGIRTNVQGEYERHPGREPHIDDDYVRAPEAYAYVQVTIHEPEQGMKALLALAGSMPRGTEIQEHLKECHGTDGPDRRVMNIKGDERNAHPIGITWDDLPDGGTTVHIRRYIPKDELAHALAPGNEAGLQALTGKLAEFAGDGTGSWRYAKHHGPQPETNSARETQGPKP